jgi:hypothetical protein
LRGVQVVGEFLVLQTVAKRYLLQLVIMHNLCKSRRQRQSMSNETEKLAC